MPERHGLRAWVVVRKDRVYLGTGLGKGELALRREVARKQLEGRERMAGQWEIAFGRVEARYSALQ